MRPAGKLKFNFEIVLLRERELKGDFCDIYVLFTFFCRILTVIAQTKLPNFFIFRASFHLSPNPCLEVLLQKVGT